MRSKRGGGFTRAPGFWLAILALALLGQACLGPVRDTRPVREEQDRFVRLEARYGEQRREGPTGFAHPFPLPPQEWTRILSSIRVQTRKDTVIFTTAKDPPSAAFDPDEIAYLSAALSEAFGRAHADEWVVFGLSRERSPQAVELTTGGWFAEGPRLHFILANYRHSVPRSQAYGRVWQDPLRTDTAPYYELVEGTFQTVKRAKGIFGGLLPNDGPELAIEYKALLAGQAREPGGSGAVEKQPATPEPLNPSDPRIEERLRVLKRLWDQGLITEEEYRQKKKQLLDRF
jgi:hypothetical protein